MAFRCIFLGAPGVGKGTFANKIVPLFNLTTISTGDLVRHEIKHNTPLGQQIKAFNDAGKLVDDEIILTMAKNKLQQVTQDTSLHGYLLDGFPRTVVQAQRLNEFTSLTAVINLNLDESVLIQKAVSRRVCKSCGAGYNLANIQRGDINMPPLLPKKEGICDKCGGGLFQRDDDTEAVVRNRLDVYNKQTFPLIEFYQKQGILHQFNIKRGLGDLPDLIELFKKLGAKPAAK